MENDMAVIRLPLEDRILDLCRLAMITQEDNGDFQPILDNLKELLHEHAEEVRKTALGTLTALSKRRATHP
jgi:hypothetical protein